jgi:sensor histidine kinase YesM
MRGREIILSFFLIFSFAAKGQDTVLLFQQPGWDSAYDMESYARYYVESGKENAAAVSQKQFFRDTNFYQTIRHKYGSKPITAWLRWIIHNPSSKEEQVALFFHKISFFEGYIDDEKGIRLLNDNHDFITTRVKNDRRSLRFAVAPGSTVKVYVRMKNAYQNFARYYPTIIRPVEYDQIMNGLEHSNRYFNYLSVLFLSIIFFIILHTLAQYFFNRRKEFLLYAFYATCVFFYFLFKFDDALHVNILFSYLPVIHKMGNNPLSYLMFFAYYRFARSFIDFKAIAPWFYKAILITEKIILTALIADIILTLVNLWPVKSMIFNVLRICLIIMAFTGITLLFRTRKPLPLFIAVGSGCFVLGALVAMILTWISVKPNTGQLDPMSYMQLGMVIELLCFTLGLSYKTSLIEKEKIATQQQLIGQLEENRKLQQELTTSLETRVQEQTSHILEQQQQLEKEKEQQLTLEFTKKITEMELQLLKSQLNPHFYFNTLHNLYGLAMIAPKKAPDAILRLSDIMEYVIYDCRHDRVPVSKELRFINSYIELEKLRYDDNAFISLQVLGDATDKHISPLLLIQFIENAFKHGLEQYKNNSYLHIDIVIEKDRLRYESVNSINNGTTNSSGGVGLANVRKRLEIIYPSKHRLNINTDNQEYKVQLELELN